MRSLAVAVALGSTLAMAEGVAAGSPASAAYSVTFQGSWSMETHPLKFPPNAHFSGLIGATHNGHYTIFREGGRATEGLERLAEAGRHSPLDEEIKGAAQAGTVGALIESGPIKPVPGQVQAVFEVDDSHPIISLVAMIAPSPDWFTGVSVNLNENGQWLAEKTITAYAWDAGTDVGSTYQAPDANSREKVTVNTAPHFQNAGKLAPVGTFTFVRQ
jgi:hypothetical protein